MGIGGETSTSSLLSYHHQQHQHHHLSSEELDTLIHRKLRGSRSIDGLSVAILALVEEWRKMMTTRKVGRGRKRYIALMC